MPLSCFLLEFSRSDGAQPHLVNVQFQQKVKLQVCIDSKIVAFVFLSLKILKLLVCISITNKMLYIVCVVVAL